MIQGYIGVGKTDLAKEIEESFPAVRFTPDEWLAILWEDPQAGTQADFDARLRRVHEVIGTLIPQVVAANVDVVLDYGIWTRAGRDRIRALAADLGADTKLYHLVSEPDVVRMRLQVRNEDLGQRFTASGDTPEAARANLAAKLDAISIAKQLSGEGQRSKQGKRWAPNYVLRILANPTYTGKVLHRGKVLDGLHEPIIDQDVFQRAQDILEKRRVSPSARASNDSDFVLTGVLICSVCRGPMIGAASHGRGQRRYRYYMCLKRSKFGDCSGARVDADALEDAIAELIVETYRDLAIFEEAIRAASEIAPDEIERLDAEIASVDADARSADAKLDRYFTAFENGSLVEDQVAARTTALGEQIQELSDLRRALIAQRRDLEAGIPDRATLELTQHQIGVVLASGSSAQLKSLYAALVESIVITPDCFATPSLRVPAPNARFRAR